VMRSWRDGNNDEEQYLWIQNEIDANPIKLQVEVRNKDLRISPNRQHIAVADERGLRILDIEGNQSLYIDFQKERDTDIRVFYEHLTSGLAWLSESTLLIAGYGYDKSQQLSRGIYAIDIHTGFTTLYFETTDYWAYGKSQSVAGFDRNNDGRLVISLRVNGAHKGEHEQLWIADPSANSLTQITQPPDYCEKPVVNLDCGKTYPRWSPDGTKILYTNGVRGGCNASRCGSYTINSDGSDETSLAGFVWNAVWSPDGETIAGTLGTTAIFYQNIITTKGGLLTDSRGIDWQ
jgi:hypothetical protein